MWIKKEEAMIKMMMDNFATKKELEVIHKDLDVMKDRQIEMISGIKVLKWVCGTLLTIVSLYVAVTKVSVSKVNDVRNTNFKEFTDSETYEIYYENLF